MARGSQSKESITQTILNTFQGSFVYGKEIRVPMDENGERVEIKITLTCAKENVGGGEANSVENGGAVSAFNIDNPASAIPTEEEKKNISDLLNRLGI